MKKKPIDNACFFTFFITMDLIWPKFCPKTTPTLIFFLLSNEIGYQKWGKFVQLSEILPH